MCRENRFESVRPRDVPLLLVLFLSLILGSRDASAEPIPALDLSRLVDQPDLIVLVAPTTCVTSRDRHYVVSVV